MKNQGDRITDLMLKLANKEPFFAYLILSQRLIEDKDGKHCPTMGVDGVRLYYNPAFTNTMTDEQLTGVLAHESLHIAYQHPFRMNLGQERDPEVWNIAADAVINPILQRRGYYLPNDTHVKIPVQKHETTEEVYDRLEKNPQQKRGASGKGAGEVMAPPPGADGECDGDEEFEAQKNIADAAQRAREAGKMPAEFETIINEAYYGKKDWKDFLRKFLGGGHERSRTWSRRNRRYPEDVHMPGNGSWGPGEVVVMIDTSGSINDDLANKFVAEVRKLTEDMTPEKVHVICCDARVQWTRTYSGYEQIDGVQFLGRGGTDFRPPFQWLEERNITPRAVVYFTDLECSSFPPEPDFPVCWIVWPGGASRAPWGEIVFM